jgi:hypothetical protein
MESVSFLPFTIRNLEIIIYSAFINYFHLVKKKEKNILRLYSTLSVPAKFLLSKMVFRKGPWFHYFDLKQKYFDNKKFNLDKEFFTPYSLFQGDTCLFNAAINELAQKNLCVLLSSSTLVGKKPQLSNVYYVSKVKKPVVDTFSTKSLLISNKFIVKQSHISDSQLNILLNFCKIDEIKNIANRLKIGIAQEKKKIVNSLFGQENKTKRVDLTKNELIQQILTPPKQTIHSFFSFNKKADNNNKNSNLSPSNNNINNNKNIFSKTTTNVNNNPITSNNSSKSTTPLAFSHFKNVYDLIHESLTDPIICVCPMVAETFDFLSSLFLSRFFF